MPSMAMIVSHKFLNRSKKQPIYFHPSSHQRNQSVQIVCKKKARICQSKISRVFRVSLRIVGSNYGCALFVCFFFKFPSQLHFIIVFDYIYAK